MTDRFVQREDRVTSAIASLISGRRKKVYFTAGHGEPGRLLERKRRGISDLRDSIRRDNADVATINLLMQPQVPQDADVIVIAGVVSPFQPQEIELLNGYVGRGGNLLVMLDPGKPHGLGTSWSGWASSRVTRPSFGRRASPGSRSSSRPYRPRPMATTRSSPDLKRSISYSITRCPSPARRDRQGRDGITELVLSPASAWGETEGLSEPAKFDEGQDHRGPLCMAIAVDSGRVGNENVDLAGARLVAVGCSSIFTNDGLLRSPLAADLAQNAINWMVRQDQLIGIAPKQPRRTGYALSVAQLTTLGLLVGIVIPASVLLIGAAAWVQRRS